MGSDYKNNFFIIIERLWLVGALIGAFICVYFLIRGDNDSALFFFGFFILSALFYILRKGQRKKQEKYLREKREKQNQ